MMEISLVTVLQLLVTGGFAVAMLIATARVKQLQAEQANHLVVAMSTLEDRIEAKLEAKIVNIRTEIVGVAVQLDRMHGQLTKLTIDLGVLQQLLKPGKETQ